MIKKDLEYISGVNILLRPIKVDDTRFIVKWRNNPLVKKNFIFQEHFTEEMHNHWMNTKVANGEVIQYIVEEKSSGIPIGSVYLRDVHQEYKSAEFGIFIGEDYARGKGYGTETVKLFIEAMFQKYGFHRIFLRVLEKNESARKIYERVGFIQEGRFKDMVKIDGCYQDVVFMAIVK